MSHSRYDPNHPKYAGLSSVPPPSMPNDHYYSEQGQAIRNQQNFDHAMMDKRIHKEKIEKLSTSLALRGDTSNKPSAPTIASPIKRNTRSYPPSPSPKSRSHLKYQCSLPIERIICVFHISQSNLLWYFK